ncbi:MAG: NTP transferase domain-containing protein [Dehalococcoidales bacterium]|nr:NTP transferase domain-containing protein [Dehalococcoidales bacterium]
MTLKEKIHKGIILAAGDGDRLGHLTITCPKVLLPVKEEAPLISYPIEALAAVGISDIAIVVGYFGDKVVEVLGDGNDFGVRLQYIDNSDYLGGNAVSVYKAREWVQGKPVVLCMGDHLIDGEIVERLLNRQVFNETLCVDYAPAHHHELVEATKIAVDGAGCIKNIGKGLSFWDALDTGVFLLTETFFLALNKLVRYHSTDVEISDVIRFLINRGHHFDTCDVSGCFWADVDTKEDLDLVRG